MPVERTVDEGDLLSAIRNLDPSEFEALVADLYRAHGHDVETTQDSYDNGRDVIVRHRFKPGRTLVQVKRYTDRLVGGPDVEQYSGLYSEPGYVRRVVLITSGPVTSEAETVASRRGVDLVDEDNLVDWLLGMDTQLTVVEQYINPEVFVEEDWPTLPNPPSGRMLALFAVGIVLMFVTAGMSMFQILFGLARGIPQALSGLYFTAGLITGLGIIMFFRQILLKQYTWPTVGAVVVAVAHIYGLFTSGYWWYRQVSSSQSVTTASVSMSMTGSGMPLSRVDPGLATLLSDVGLVVHLMTAFLFGVGLLWARWTLRYRLCINPD